MVNTRSSAQSNPPESSREYSVTSAERFHNDLSSNISMAWRARASEHRLYTVFSHICSHLCEAVEPPGYPKNTISHTPQELFGVEVPPLGSEPQPPINKKELYEERIPDFARHIFCSANNTRLIIDGWELKGLNIPHGWNTPEARKAAWKAINGELEQVFTTAMAGFAHNPGWQHIHILLIIGVYFSQFVWTRPEGEIKRELPDISINHVLTKQEMDNVLKRYEDRIAQFKSRALPEVQFYNVPVFKFHTPTDDHPIRVTLSPEFLYATRLPLKKHFTNCKFLPTWLSPPSRKPGRGWTANSGDPNITVRLELIDNKVSFVKLQIQNLREQSASPANPKESPGYQPNHRLKVSLQKSPLAGKVARPRRIIPGVKRGAVQVAAQRVGPAPAQEQQGDGQYGEPNQHEEHPVEDPGDGGMLAGAEADHDSDRQSDGEEGDEGLQSGEDDDDESNEDSDDPDANDPEDNEDNESMYREESYEDPYEEDGESFNQESYDDDLYKSDEDGYENSSFEDDD